MSKLSKGERDERDIRKGLLPVREDKPVASKKGRDTLLEYYVLDHQVGLFYNRQAGWVRHGNYKSHGQALRVIEQIKVKQSNGVWYMGPPPDCKWRINGVEV